MTDLEAVVAGLAAENAALRAEVRELEAVCENQDQVIQLGQQQMDAALSAIAKLPDAQMTYALLDTCKQLLRVVATVGSDLKPVFSIQADEGEEPLLRAFSLHINQIYSICAAGDRSMNPSAVFERKPH